jgi:uncharacterized protein CbrC (UPF0167 family)
MTTFANLGIPFVLFEASVEEAADYVGLETCSLCNQENSHCFELSIGADVMCACPRCAQIVALDAADREAAACAACGASTPFPTVSTDRLLCCYACLRAGRAAMTKDTQFGMIRYADAIAGVTHGRPGLSRADFERVQLDEGWVGAKVPSADMLELTRTPGYLTIQGEQWLFCCAQPMTYLGVWTSETFNEMAEGGDGRALFDKIVPDASDDLWEDNLHDETGIYVFRCRMCGERAAHWDLA